MTKAAVCLRAQVINENNRGVGGRQGIDDVSEGSEMMAEAEES